MLRYGLSRNRIRKVTATLIMGCTLMLSGCGEKFPEMTQEEYDQTVQYAVRVLMKHSNNGVERLALVSQRRIRELDEDPWAITPPGVDDMAEAPVSEPDMTETGQTTDSSASSAAAETPSSVEEEEPAVIVPGEETEQNTEPEQEEMPEQEIKGSDDKPTETDVEMAGSKEEETEQEETPAETEETVEGYEHSFSNGLELSYAGYSVTNSYTNDSFAYAMEADAGKKLLILSFMLSNMTGKDQEVDMIRTNPYFQILVNGKNLGYTMVTVLEDDLSAFKGTIPAGTKKSLVLAIQVDNATAKSIESLGMIVTMNGETKTYSIE